MNYKDILDVDPKKVAMMMKLNKAVVLEEMSLEELAEELEKNDLYVKPEEFSYVEQELSEAGILDDIYVNKAMELFLVYDSRLKNEKKLPHLSADHPLILYHAENEEMRHRLSAGVELTNQPFNAAKWHDYANDLQAFKVHFVRKQNQLYPCLEDRGFNRPSRIMWTFDDEARDALTELLKTTEDGNEKAVLSSFHVAREALLNVMRKEERALFPTAFRLIDLNAFLKMEIGDAEIGYAFIEPPQYSQSEVAMMRGLESLMLHHDGTLSNESPIDLSRGKLTIEQLNLLFKYLPYDISFIDEQELVRFYNEKDTHIFTRSPGVIGRNVKNCHPRDSLRMVTEIFDRFRNGEQTEAEFWIEKDNRFIYIRYLAVHDKIGTFRGVVEIAEDATRVRELTGFRSFLEWKEI